MAKNRERKRADTIGTVLVPRAGHIQMYIQIKYTEAISSHSTRKLLRSKITKVLSAVLKNKFVALFIIIFGTPSFPAEDCQARKLNKEDAVDRCKWRKVIKEVR